MKRSRSYTGFCDHNESQEAAALPACEWEEVLDKLLTKGQAQAGIRAVTDTLHCVACGAESAISSDKPSCGHALAVDVQRLELYCMRCRDYVYLKQFDEAVVLWSQCKFQQQQQNANATNRLPETDPGADLQAKRQKVQAVGPAGPEATRAVSPKQQQQQQLQDSCCNLSSPTAAAATGPNGLDALGSLSSFWESLKAPDGFPLGLRGLNNLGNTCFMNSVLQVLFHAPLMPAFYLGEGHDPTTCRLTAKDKPCLSCQLESVFSEVYSGNRQPFSPAEFLYQWWRFADSLAGYQQQDAHEFYLSLLEGLSGSLVPLPALDAPAADTEAGQEHPPAAGTATAGDIAQNKASGVNQATAVSQVQQQQPSGLPLPAGGGALQHLQQQQQPGLLQTQSDFMQQHPFPAGPAGVAAAGMPLFQFDVLGSQVAYSGANGWQACGQQQEQVAAPGGGELSGYETPLSSAGTPEPQWEAHAANQPQGPCAGLVELLFSGLLRSDVCCCACGHTSTAHDPFRDISLDLHVPRPPKLPPSEPHNRPLIPPRAAVAAAAVPAATGLQSPGVRQAEVFMAGTVGGGVSAAGAAGQGVREPTPPLLLLTPSPTPHPSDSLVEYLEDNDDDAAGGQVGLSSLGLDTQSPAISASELTRPASCAQPCGELTGMTEATTGVSPDVDGDEVQCRSSVAPQAAPIALFAVAGPTAGDSKADRSRLAIAAGIGATDAAALPVQLSKAGTIAAYFDAGMSTETSVTPEVPPTGAMLQPEQSYKREATPALSELGGPAASQSSQQIGGGAGPAAGGAGGAGGNMREGTPELDMLGMQDGTAGELASQTQGAAQQHYASAREATPQSQHPAPHMAQQEQQRLQLKLQQQGGPAGSELQQLPGTGSAAGGGATATAGGVASSLVRNVSGSLGQLVRAPVAAIKQLLPGWTSNSHEQEHHQQTAEAPAAVIAAPPNAAAAAAAHGHGNQPSAQAVEGDGESMAGKGVVQRQPHLLQSPHMGWAEAVGQQQAHQREDVAWQQQQPHSHGILSNVLLQQQQQQQQQCQQHVPVSSSTTPGMLLQPGSQYAPLAAGAAAAAGGKKCGGSNSTASKPAGGSRVGSKAAAALKLPRQTRCGKCRYCLNKHLKKGCEANKKLREEQKQAALLAKEQQRAAAAAASAGATDPAAAAAAPAPTVPFGDPSSAATQPAHPLAGVAAAASRLQEQVLPDQQQQCGFQHQVQQQQWPGLTQEQQLQQQYQQQSMQDWMMYYQHHDDHCLSNQGLGLDLHRQQQQQQHSLHHYQHQGFGCYPHPQQPLKQQQKPKQQQKKQQPTAAKQQKKPLPQKQRVSPKPPAGLMAQDAFTNTALEQGLMQRRDGKGRFFNKENMAAWARQLHSEGLLTGVPGVADATADEVAAAKALGRDLPPAYLAAQAAKEALAAAATGTALPPKAGGPAAGAAKAGGNKSGALKKSSAGGAAAGAGKKHTQPPPVILRMNELSLAGCLRRFVRPERLGPGAHWHCSACGSSQSALKQMSIRRLPLVLCFHVKRFEHGGGTLRPKKLDVPMRFPLQGLDMAPFTTSAVLRSRAGGIRCSAAAEGSNAGLVMTAAACRDIKNAEKNRQQAPQPSADDINFQQQCLYELFGVVSHSGDMASGHYVSYVKCEGHWYLVNDPWVVAVSEADVAQVQAYMLFYAQEYLFGSGSSPSSMAGQNKEHSAADRMQNTAMGAAAADAAAGAATAVKSETAVKAEDDAAVLKLEEAPEAVAEAVKQETVDPAAAAAVQQPSPGPTVKGELSDIDMLAISAAPVAGGESAVLPSLPPAGRPRSQPGDLMMIDDLSQQLMGADDLMEGLLEEQASAAGLGDMAMA